MGFVHLYVYFIIASFFISLIVYFRPSPSYLKYFPPFLLITSCVEIYGDYLQSIFEHNMYIYNPFSVFEFIFYLTIIGMATTSKRWKKMIFISVPVYAILGFINVFFIIGKDTFHSSTYCLGSLLVVISCIHYMLELFRLAKWNRLSENPAFWICSGLLFFYICGFFYFGLMNYWGSNPKWYFLMKNFLPISNILNIALYTLFAIAFICNRIRKYTLSSS